MCQDGLVSRFSSWGYGLFSTGVLLLIYARTLQAVRGWYPTTQWSPGGVIRDQYELTMPTATIPTAVEITKYTVDEAGQFVNNEWFVIRLPDSRETEWLQPRGQSELALNAVK